MAKTAKKKAAKKKSVKKNGSATENPPAPVKDEPQLPGAPLDAPPRGLEEVGPEDLVIPRFRIVQPSSKSESGTEGHFHDIVSGEEFTELEGVVPLKFAKGRVYFLKPEEGGGLRCASDDRVRPADRIEEPVQETCAGCPKSRWTTVDGRRVPPPCAETWTMLMAVDGVPYFITFKKAAMKATKRLLTHLRLRAQKERLDLCGFQFDMRLELKEFETGKAYLPVFENVSKVPGKDYANYQSIYDAFAHMQPVYDDDEGEDLAEAGAAGDAGDGGEGGEDPGSFDFGD